MKYDPSIHHRKSIRLSDWDYSQPGAYFVTIVTHNRQHLFGRVVDGEMRLNEIGLLVEREWKRIPERFPGYQIGPFIIMPNHHHGVLDSIHQNDLGDCPGQRPGGDRGRGGAKAGLPGLISASCPALTQDAPYRQIAPLGLVVNQFKSTTTRLSNGLCRSPGNPLWQRNYYEHIIRDDEDYERIADYILGNPLKWEEDDLFFP